jgi:predicted nucleotidyltransferase
MTVMSIIKKHAREMKGRFHLARIGVFGSCARGEETAGSDVDILVEFEEGCKTFDNYMDLKYHLEDLLGRKVDLVTTTALRPRMKDNILRETLYA